MQNLIKGQKQQQWENNDALKKTDAGKNGPANGFNIFDNKEITNDFRSQDSGKMLLLQKLAESGTIPTLQLKVLSSAHLEKDFTLLINTMGVVPN